MMRSTTALATGSKTPPPSPNPTSRCSDPSLSSPPTISPPSSGRSFAALFLLLCQSSSTSKHLCHHRHLLPPRTSPSSPYLRCSHLRQHHLRFTPMILTPSPTPIDQLFPPLS